MFEKGSTPKSTLLYVLQNTACLPLSFAVPLDPAQLLSLLHSKQLPFRGSGSSAEEDGSAEHQREAASRKRETESDRSIQPRSPTRSLLQLCLAPSSGRKSSSWYNYDWHYYNHPLPLYPCSTTTEKEREREFLVASFLQPNKRPSSFGRSVGLASFLPCVRFTRGKGKAAFLANSRHSVKGSTSSCEHSDNRQRNTLIYPYIRIYIELFFEQS